MVDLGQNGVQLLDRSLAGLDDVGEVGSFVGFELRATVHWRTGRGLAVDVHDGIAQNPDGLEAGCGVGTHSVSIFGSDLKGHLDRGELARGHDPNFSYGADRIAFEVDRSTL